MYSFLLSTPVRPLHHAFAAGDRMRYVGESIGDPLSGLFRDKISAVFEVGDIGLIWSNDGTETGTGCWSVGVTDVGLVAIGWNSSVGVTDVGLMAMGWSLSVGVTDIGLVAMGWSLSVGVTDVGLVAMGWSLSVDVTDVGLSVGVTDAGLAAVGRSSSVGVTDGSAASCNCV